MSVVLLTALLKLEITVSFFWLSLPVRSGSLKSIKYSKLYSLAHTLLLNVFSALYILFMMKPISCIPFHGRLGFCMQNDHLVTFYHANMSG